MATWKRQRGQQEIAAAPLRHVTVRAGKPFAKSHMAVRRCHGLQLPWGDSTAKQPPPRSRVTAKVELWSRCPLFARLGLLHPQHRTFSWPSLTSGFDPKATFVMLGCYTNSRPKATRETPYVGSFALACPSLTGRELHRCCQCRAASRISLGRAAGARLGPTP